MPPTSGARGGSFTIPTTGQTAANVWYRIHLTVRDSAGATQTVQRDVLPRTVPTDAGHQSRRPTAAARWPTGGDSAPFDSVVGIVRTLEATTPQASGGTTLRFVSWSDGGAASHPSRTPAANTTYTATFDPRHRRPGTGLSATYFNNVDFTGTRSRAIDPTVDFAWGSGSPAAGIGPDTFSVRWTGQVEAPLTGPTRSTR